MLQCPTVSLSAHAPWVDPEKAYVAHASMSVSDSQRTRSLGVVRKNVSKTGTHMRLEFLIDFM